MSALSIDIRLQKGAFSLSVTESLHLTGITAVFGASGSGKTSLLRAIAGLERDTQGSIRFRDRDWLAPGACVQPEQRKVGYVFQDARLFAHLDVRGNLDFARKHGKRTGVIEPKAVTDALDLTPLLSRAVTSLSGGEAQRVAIGRALLSQPELLLMDEPLSSLDVTRKRDLLPLIGSLPKRFGLPILYVTHDLDELTCLADEVVLLRAGRNEARGSVREILARTDFTRLTELDDPGSVLEARVEGQEGRLTLAAVGNNRLRIPAQGIGQGEMLRLRVHARDVIIATAEPHGLSIRNSLQATIESIEARSDGQLTIRLSIAQQTLTARITQQAADELRLEPGQQVFALIKSVALDAVR